MAEPPRRRVIDSPPFKYCGVDMFGPFTIKKRLEETEEILHNVYMPCK